jgi:RHS repeat-associated protein
MGVATVFDRELSLEAMWHGYRASDFVAQDTVAIDTGVVCDLLQARYYDGSKGQFLSEDPVFWGDPKQQALTDPQSLNSYSYANDNPIIKKDPDGRLAFGVSYGGGAEGGFGAFSATNVSSGATLVFDPKTFQASIVFTTTSAVNAGYLKNYQSAPDNGQPPFVIGLFGGVGRSYSFSPYATKPEDLEGVQDSINVNLGRGSFSAQGADTNNPTYTVGGGTKGFASASRYPVYTQVVSTISINQSISRATTQVASYYASAVASIKAQINAIQAKLNELSSKPASKSP